MRKLFSMGYILTAIAFLLWSYTQVDRQLYYLHHPLFVAVQDYFWRLPNNVALWLYLIGVSILFALYIYAYQIFSKRVSRGSLVFFLCIAFVFALSNPALSYDLYNYTFDARLVLHYGKDPHVTAAASYLLTDDWVRFMRNISFPTTYGYAWTILSLVPYSLAFGKFSLTFLSFKLFALLGYIVLFFIQKKILEQTHPEKKEHLSRLSLFFLSPLTLIEVLVNGHNDIWMMVLAHASIFVLFFSKKSYRYVGLSFVLLLLSTQIKRATVVLLPLWGMLAVSIRTYWADIAALLLFLPLFTALSRQFHPWYLLWSLSFLPFVQRKELRMLLIFFSLTSLLRYVPYLYIREYSDQLMIYSKMITWSAIPLFSIVQVCILFFKKRKHIQ